MIFVVDSNDHDRIQEARYELHDLLNDEKLNNVDLLVLANKQDLPNAMSSGEIADKLGLHTIKQHEWNVQPTCANTGEGLYEGLEWLRQTLMEKNQIN